VILLAGILIGLFLLAPVAAHVGGSVGHLWRQHLRPKADARYLHFVQTVESGPITIGANGVEEAVAFCPFGTVVVGGGFQSVGFDATLDVASSRPVPEDNAWRVVAANPGTGDGTLDGYAICAAVG
jgi:hypothetical protein